MTQIEKMQSLLERVANTGECTFTCEIKTDKHPWKTSWIISKGNQEIWIGNPDKFTWNDFDMAVASVLEWFK